MSSFKFVFSQKNNDCPEFGGDDITMIKETLVMDGEALGLNVRMTFIGGEYH